jgi:TonB family protein
MRETALTAALLACMILLTCGAARSGAQPSQTFGEATAAVNRLLQSSDVKDVAWGAFTASQYHVVSAVPVLTAALGRELGPDADARRAAELAILDALVQLDAHVPVEALRPSLDRWPIPTLILLGSSIGDRDALLLERFSTTNGFEWQAIANLLLKSKPPGFAFRLLEGLRLRLTIYVTDDPSRGFGSGLGSGIENSGLGRGSENGANYVLSVPGFPPLAVYQFVLAGPGATVLSIGPQTVYYARRMRSPAVLPPLTRSTLAKPNDFDRVQYVNALVRERVETVPLPDQTSVTVVWTNPQAFRQDIPAHRKRVEDLYHNIVSGLVLSKRLTEDESRTLTPNITIAIEDKRSDKAELLPAIEERGAAAGRSPRRGPVRRIHDVHPVWPEAAQRANVRGTVLVEFTITIDGGVTDARILRGIPLLDEAALDCVRQWRYEPVLFDGRPAPMATTAAVSFP